MARLLSFGVPWGIVAVAALALLVPFCVRSWQRGTRPAFALADASVDHKLLRWTVAARVTVAAILTGLLATAAISAPIVHTPRLPRSLLGGSSAIIVLDLSGSITGSRSAPFTRPAMIREALAAFAEAGDEYRFGLVLFFDTAYEAIPPDAKPEALKPFLRYFTPIVDPEMGRSSYPVNPWQDSFSSGTAISTGLRLAWEMIERDHLPKGTTIVLMSDLDDSASDVPEMTDVLVGLTHAGYPVRIIGLAPEESDREYFEVILGPEAFSEEFSVSKPVRGSVGVQPIGDAAPPWRLIVATIAMAVALAMNEISFGGRVRLPRRSGKEEQS